MAETMNPILVDILTGALTTYTHYRESQKCRVNPKYGKKDDAITRCRKCDIEDMLAGIIPLTIKGE